MDFLKTPLSSAPPGLAPLVLVTTLCTGSVTTVSQQWAWAAWPLGVLLHTEVLLISDAWRSQASPGPNT